MNEHEISQGTAFARARAEEEEVRQLLSAAGRRQEVPAEDMAVITAAAREEWRGVVAAEERRAHLGRRTMLALAASLLLAVLAGWWWFGRGVPGVPPVSGIVATVDLLSGQASIVGAPAEVLAAGRSLAAGTVLETADERGGSASRLAIRLAGGQSARLDSGTRVTVSSASRLELARGALYVDSGPEPSGGAVEIGTAYGTVSDIGTQFEVRLGEDDSALSIRVREGMVLLASDGESHQAIQGEELRLWQDGSVARGQVDPRGAAWDWVIEAAPRLNLDGLTLGEYLDRWSRETAWEVRWSSEELAESSSGIELSGSLHSVSLEESVDAVLPSTGLAYRLDDGVLFILEASR